MTINLNADPYFDDFDEDKNFHQILFKPGFAVQTRELNQLQSILRDQTKKFGNHVFRQGSVVIPGNSLSDLAVPYIKLLPTYGGLALDLTTFIGKTLVGTTSGLTAIVKHSAAATLTDSDTLYLSYTSGSATGAVSFIDGEEVTVASTSIGATLIASSATGVGSLAFINSGVYYVNGTFVSVLPQTTILSKYDSSPDCKVLLKITEEVVNTNTDETLLDNANGSYNYNAPGADRLKITLTLTTLETGVTVADDYVEIMRYAAGILTEHALNPKYTELEKSLARRTFDESGNYVVDGLEPIIKEHLKSNNNGGVYPSGDISKLVVDVSPGKAYISGFEVDKIASTKLVIDKARTASHIKDTDITLRPEFGQYIIISDIVGYFDIHSQATINLYNDNDPANVSATQIGTATVVGIDYLAGDIATGAIYKLWVSKVAMSGSYTLNSTGGIRYGSSYSAHVLTEYNAPVSLGTFQVAELITHTTSGRTATVAYWNPVSATLYAFKHDHTKETPSVGDSIVGSVSTTVSTIKSKSTLTSVGQSGLVFRLPKAVPYTLKNPVSTSYDLRYTVQKELSITTNASGDGSVSVSSGETISPIEVGTFQAIDVSGVVQNTLFSLNVDGTTLTVTGAAISTVIKVYANVEKDSVSPKTKTVTSHAQVVSSPTSVTVLDKTDIIRITSVIDTVGDITSSYQLWDGQDDTNYNFGKLTLKSGKSAPVGAITITYQYYQHSIAGDFFCVDSYPVGSLESVINYNSLSTGQLFDLPTCIDFRSSASNRNDLIVNGTTFTSSLQFYVPRIDTLCVNPQGTLTIFSGVPSENPVAINIPTGQFALNLLYISAYTKSSQETISRRLDVEGFTMNDIKKISRRVINVEDFATLTASELSVTTENVIDAATGLDMFKTGYLVETFNTPLTIARTTASDYSASFVEGVLYSAIEELQCDLVISDQGDLVNRNGYLMLPYTETAFASQTLSSRTTNLNPFLMIKWDGLLSCVPASDDWTEVRDNATIFEETTEDVEIITYINCPVNGGGGPPPPPPPLPATTYGGFYGAAFDRAGEAAGVAWWVNDSTNLGVSKQQIAEHFISSKENTDAIAANAALGGVFNPISLETLMQESVLTSTTSYSYGSGGKLISTTTGTNFDGTTFTEIK